jgi:hypothetical protein
MVFFTQIRFHNGAESRRFVMRLVTLILFASAFCFGQTNTGAPTAPSQATTPTPEAVMAPAAATASSADPNAVTIPAGTKIPLVLKQAISTKNGREDDAVYAETAFPFVLDGHILVPAGTYVQGRITHIERGGHIKGRAQVLMHFTSLIYPSGYTVMLPGYVDNTPGAEHSSVKDAEGTIRQDSQTGEKIEKVAGAAGTGAVIGGLSDGLKGAGIDWIIRPRQ